MIGVHWFPSDVMRYTLIHSLDKSFQVKALKLDPIGQMSATVGQQGGLILLKRLGGFRLQLNASLHPSRVGTGNEVKVWCFHNLFQATLAPRVALALWVQMKAKPRWKPRTCKVAVESTTSSPTTGQVSTTNGRFRCCVERLLNLVVVRQSTRFGLFAQKHSNPNVFHLGGGSTDRRQREQTQKQCQHEDGVNEKSEAFKKQCALPKVGLTSKAVCTQHNAWHRLMGHSRQ